MESIEERKTTRTTQAKESTATQPRRKPGLSYWQAEALRNIMYAGEYRKGTRQGERGYWVQYCHDWYARCPKIHSRTIKWLLDQGYLYMSTLVSDPSTQVCKPTLLGLQRMAEKFAGHYKREAKFWAEVREKRGMRGIEE